MSMPDSLKPRKSGYDLSDLVKAADAQGAGEGVRPVETWHPERVAKMDMVIKRDGSWWHEGGKITRESLVNLFASILRKDEDGKTYLVTPVEKLEIEVEVAHFLAVRMDVIESGETQRLIFTTNVGDVVELGPERPLTVLTNPETEEPTPLIRVRGRLDALLTRSVFYELVEYAVEKEDQLGVWSRGSFFPLGSSAT